jgi:phage recombination protein Bet
MTEKKEAVQIVAKFVKISGVMVFLEEPGKEEYALPADLKICKVIKDGDKIHAGESYTWKIVEDGKGNRSILTAGPADGFQPASQLPKRDSKEILQQNLDEKRKEPKKAAPATPQKVDESIGLPEECQTCVYVHDCPTLKPRENCKQAMGHKLKDDAEGDARLEENAAYAAQLVAEKEEKDRQKAISAQKAPAQRAVVIHPEIVKESALATVSHALPQSDCQHMGIAKTYTDEDLLLIRNIAAKNCTEQEFKLLMYMAKTYGLDPLLKEIWCVKRNESAPALIFAGRDGFLRIAHESGQFDGLQSGVIYESKTVDAGKPTERQINVPVSAWCKVWRKDMIHEFISDVPFSEYNTGFSVWKTNPSAMILKVAEAVCLRKAFTIAGIYSPEEIDTEHR